MPNRARTFIRHPSDVPIQISLVWAADQIAPHPGAALHDISLGGLAFRSPKPLPLGQPVKVSFPLLSDQRALSGKVVWITGAETRFEIGLQFNDPDELYCLRMVEQICHIEHYRREVAMHEGRQISSEQAAQEWIPRYAHSFPGLDNV